ncbi:unnamed protein product, partial [Taenia asiatica]|uniref:XPGI domain-containing protein n=1 Tax=Taenia asiatica TaxID=60517 RepID=A0A0R3W0I7_TAEAS
KSLPAVGEEYVGLPIGKIPPDFAELFNASINIDESGLEGEGEEWIKEGKETSDKMLRMVLLGASTYQVPAARDRFAEKKSKKSETEKPQRTSDAKSQLQSLRLKIMMPTNLPLDLPLVISQHTLRYFSC